MNKQSISYMDNSRFYGNVQNSQARIMATFERLESEVRTYCRSFPTVFSSAKGAILSDTQGRRYLDFLCGAGALNYGHNHDSLVSAIRNHLDRGLLIQGLDLYSEPKFRFIHAFERHILRPRRLDRYRFQFTGPTGADAVEAAIKLARLATDRTSIAAFTNGYHGVSLGALGVTGSAHKRAAAGVPLGETIRLPYDGYIDESIAFIRKAFLDESSGFQPPAAFIVEVVQGEGGLSAASSEWLLALQDLARALGSLLIIDDIQAGCGRTGTFFSFEGMGVEPDIICLSKSLSGIGLPMSILLLKENVDVWSPGAHVGTFRGNNLAFTTAAATIETFWTDASFQKVVKAKGDLLKERLTGLGVGHVVGRGMMLGLRFPDGPTARAVSKACFERGLIAETCGQGGAVLKLLPPLVIEEDELVAALEILANAITASSAHQPILL